MTNALYSQFMADVDHQVKRVTPEALKIKKCYATFTAGLERLDNTFVVQRKDNRSVEIATYDAARDSGYSCFNGHINADLSSLIPDHKSAAQILRNKLDAYGYLPGLGNNEESAKMGDLCKDLQVAPLAELVEKLGRTADVKAMKDANDAFISLSRERTESGKAGTDATKAARADQDKNYRDMIAVVNSQITLSNLMDDEGGEEERPGELSLLAGEEPLDPLTDFAQSINAIIKEYKTKMAQSGKGGKDDSGKDDSGNDERPGEL